jgi:PKHD-type hydroxylase
MYVMPQISKPIEPYAWSSNVFTDSELDLIKEMGNKADLETGSVNQQNNPNTSARRSEIAWLYHNDETDFIYHKLSQAVAQLNEVFYNYDLTTMEPLQYSIYDSSYKGMYRNHTDDSYDAKYYRKLSFSLQLNESEEYEGGDLCLYRFKLTDPMIVKKQKGLLAVFPSSTIHEVTPVTRGKRLALVGWTHGPRFK